MCIRNSPKFLRHTWSGSLPIFLPEGIVESLQDLSTLMSSSISMTLFHISTWFISPPQIYIRLEIEIEFQIMSLTLFMKGTDHEGVQPKLRTGV